MSSHVSSSTFKLGMTYLYFVNGCANDFSILPALRFSQENTFEEFHATNPVYTCIILCIHVHMYHVVQDFSVLVESYIRGTCRNPKKTLAKICQFFLVKNMSRGELFQRLSMESGKSWAR